jgi:hypothetical protein
MGRYPLLDADQIWFRDFNLSRKSVLLESETGTCKERSEKRVSVQDGVVGDSSTGVETDRPFCDLILMVTMRSIMVMLVSQIELRENDER